MFSTHSFRSRIALWTIAGVVFAGSSIVALPAQASWTYAGSMSFTRAGDGGSITVKPSETVAIESLHELTPDWSGWPLKRRAVLTKSPFTVAPQSGLTIDADSSWRYWQGSGSDDCYFFEDVAKLTVDDSMTCANSLYAADRLTVTNTTGVNKTVTTNASSQVLKNGKKKISGVGVDKSVSGVVQIEDTSILESGYAIDADVESTVSFNYEFCIYEENITAGDELTIIPHVFLNGGSIDSEFLTVYDDYDLDGDGNYENDLTFNVSPDGVQDDLRVSFSVAVADSAIAEMDGINYGLYSLGDVYQGGSSVIEPCADSETPRWAGEYGFGTVASESQPQMNWGVDISLDLPDYATFDSENWDGFGSESDGFGGMFFKKSPTVANGSARVVLYQRDGIDSNFNGSGYVDLPTDADGYLYIGSYGVGGSRFASVAQTTKSAWTLTLGSKSTSGATTNTMTKKALAKLCPAGFAPSWIALISAPTTDPLLWLSCAKGNTQRHVITKWASGKLSTIKSLGSPSKKFTCVVPTMGIDTRATGTEAAIVIYTRTSKTDSDGFCGSTGEVSDRSMMTISAAGVGSDVTTMGDPWEGGDEPAYIQIAAGSDPGSWIGLTYNSSGDMWSPATIGRPFTLDIAGFDLLADEVFLDPSTDFGYWSSVTPIAEIGPNTWTVAVKGSATVDGDNVSRGTLGTLNLETGQITNGDIGEFRDFGYTTSRHIDQISYDSNGNMTWYVNTGTNEYVPMYWTLPIG